MKKYIQAFLASKTSREKRLLMLALVMVCGALFKWVFFDVGSMLGNRSQRALTAAQVDAQKVAYYLAGTGCADSLFNQAEKTLPAGLTLLSHQNTEQILSLSVAYNQQLQVMDWLVNLEHQGMHRIDSVKVSAGKADVVLSPGMRCSDNGR
ncbi:hypothetical protein DT73_15870 [Mangrovibacter sp. MFB070]|uniref:hypothetical protein n=1 Tax=Mangrovibacter sp. MFB070 TaxID=1224318 RepID=UPI0004D826EC|nr:hypothetical protein [Mangrovibacter sp. MFB070]KEA52365.1 hypothetical protein DT73_15870 [Mangrovibacter sp. MFB070]